MTSIAELRRWGREALHRLSDNLPPDNVPPETVALEVDILLCAALGLDRAQLYPERILEADAGRVTADDQRAFGHLRAQVSTSVRLFAGFGL